MKKKNDNALRMGLVGGARRRDGLGPFLATHLQAHGANVEVLFGRDVHRMQATAAELSARLGHSVTPAETPGCPSPAALAALELDGLVIASPTPTHRPYLEVARSAVLPVLCEKPLVAPAELGVVPDLVAGFVEAGVPLLENCQWPFVLGAFRDLHPEARVWAEGGHFPERMEMRLSPSGDGREMLTESLSHFLSVMQAVGVLGTETRVTGLKTRGMGGPEAGLDLDLEVENLGKTTAATLFLRPCVEQPRPAWLAIDGARIDRCIDMPGYEIFFVSGEKRVRIDDPVARLVYRFVHLVREVSCDRIRDEAERIDQRARFFAHVIRALDAC